VSVVIMNQEQARHPRFEDDPLRAHKPARRQNGGAEQADGGEGHGPRNA
jgi:hypothetical protein